MAYTRVNWENYPSTNTPRNATNLNKMDKGIYDVDSRLVTAESDIDTAEANIALLKTGWNLANETWTYSSVDNPTGVITITGDKTGKYSLGMRIKFTNGGNVIYGIITAISYSSPNTTLTFLHEINPSTSTALHLMANSAITANYYSNMKAPYGFPMNPDKWSVKVTTSSNASQTNAVTGTWYNLGGINISIPIGLFKVSYSALGALSLPSPQMAYLKVTLSTTNNSATIPSATQKMAAYTTSEIDFTFFKEALISTTAKTLHYLNAFTDAGGNGFTLYFLNSQQALILQATCAYL